jgi:ribonucleoside-triphosphate reductase
MALLTEKNDPKDKEYGDFTAEMYSEGHSFFTYMSDNADSLSSCCRLRNEIQDNGFSYTLGAGGVSTGSKSVLTINLNRCIQYAVNNNIDYKEYLSEVIDLVHKVQMAYNENLKLLQEKGMLPLFDAGYINMSRQYLTIGVNGLVEAAEFMGLKINDNPDYLQFVQTVLGLVEKYNKQYRSKDLLFNCEMIPAENVGVKHAKWDREDGYFVPRDCYNSYFYVVEDDSLNIIDKFKLHGAPYIQHLTGGSALHMNLEEHLSKVQYRHLLKVAAKEGCNYFTFNIPNTICNDCGHIDKRYLKVCPHCQSKNVDYMTRIIGYLKRVSNFSKPRQDEAVRRFYNKSEAVEKVEA